LRPLGLVVDPRGGAHEHEGVDEVGPLEGEVQGEAPAHRVADVRRPSCGPAEERGAVAQVGAVVGAASVRGRVDGEYVVPLGEAGEERVPAPPRLGEAVDEDDLRAVGVAVLVGVESRRRRHGR
jgi:hypothetical protein